MNKITALTTLNQSEYDKLFSVFSPLMEEKISLYTLKGKNRSSRKYKESKRSSLFGSNKKLNFILIYLKEIHLFYLIKIFVFFENLII